MWPFGTSAKDRKRIEDLETVVERLRSAAYEVSGNAVPGASEPWGSSTMMDGLYNGKRLSNIQTISQRVTQLEEDQRAIMAAAGLERYTQPSKTWIGKKGKPNV